MSRNMDVALVTYDGLPALADDDRPLVAALAARGIDAKPVQWNDAALWSGAPPLAAVIRSTWDYHLRREAFLAWGAHVEKTTKLWNPLRVLRWNSHKGYLRDLEARGVRVVATAWPDRFATFDLGALLAERGWDDAVVKTAVSAAAFRTARFDRTSLAAGGAHLARILEDGDAMVQPYLRSVEVEGERSLVMINGSFSHAVRKHAALAEGTAARDDEAAVDVEREALSFAERALEACGFETLYARIDLARDAAGQLTLMELELIEPSLFLRQGSAIERFADAIAARVG